MDPMQILGRAMIVIAAVLGLIGAFLLLASKSEFLKKIPGNFAWKLNGVTIYFPLALCIIISLILTLIFWLLGRRG
ncbi:MAG: DUF2905 domain-containing protein [Planctomycetota bacterium]|nr:MAG: DUF2905 domain-containing protein [Planctomycetota bacterium]